MKETKGWDLATLQSPAAVHLALTLPSSSNAQQFAEDLREAVQTVQGDTMGKWVGGNAGIYGLAASVPASFIEESVKVYLDTYTKAVE